MLLIVAFLNVHFTMTIWALKMWATKGWKRNNALTQQYAAFYESIKDRVRVYFHKVAAHTGDTYNEMADALAKQGAGI